MAVNSFSQESIRTNNFFNDSRKSRGSRRLHTMSKESLIIDAALVRRLVSTQFPKWANLDIRPVPTSGWDNRTFHLGEHMLVRLPSAEVYSLQVNKEHSWLPKLAPFLPIPIPEPLGLGEPAYNYPWRWSVYSWLDGDTAASAHITNLCEFATSLAQFLTALQSIDTKDGPLPGLHNFYRGGSLMTYDAEARQALSALKNKIDFNTATEVWNKAIATSWQQSPIWIHGDVSAGNLLVHKRRLSAVIDFGQLGVGDPACDLSIAWTFFEGKSRDVFKNMLPFDSGTWARGRAWTLWKASIIAAGITDANAVEAAKPLRVIDEVLIDYKRNA